MHQLPFDQADVEEWSLRLSEAMEAIGDDQVLALVQGLASGDPTEICEGNEIISSMVCGAAQICMLTWLLRSNWQ